MNKKKVMLGSLALVSALIWIRGLGVIFRPKAKSMPAGYSQEAHLPSELPKKVFLRTAFKNWGRDPFFAVRALESQSPGMQLVGIMYDEKETAALINDRIVHIGDHIEANTVVAIEKDRVVLNDGTHDFELKLEQ